MNVLLLTGYWPVVGTSVAVALRGDGIFLIVPYDEEALARRGGADKVIPFHPATLETLESVGEALRDPLRAVAHRLPAGKCRIAFEDGEVIEPFSYAAIHLFGRAMERLLLEALPSSTLESADKTLAQLRSVKTSAEVSLIEMACKLAERAFLQGANQLCPGLTELEAAALFQGPLSTALAEFPSIERAGGLVSCMSGPNSAFAGAAYARSRRRRLAKGDLVLIHCNSLRGWALDRYHAHLFHRTTRSAREGNPQSRIRGTTGCARSDTSRGKGFSCRSGGSGRTPGAWLRFAIYALYWAWGGLLGNKRKCSAASASQIPGRNPAGHDLQYRARSLYRSIWGPPPLRRVGSNTTGTQLLTSFQCRPEELILDV